MCIPFGILSFMHGLNWYASDGLVQDCSNSSALAMELLQACAKASIFPVLYNIVYRCVTR